jgi:aquaporin Z
MRLLPEGSQKYVAEFLGTFMLVFSVGCNVLAGSRIWLATSIAATLTVLVYIFGDISGANLNPAVSVALWLTGKMNGRQAATYCVIQCLAAVVAGFSYSLILWEVFTLQPAKGYSWWEAGLAEILYTCMLCFVVLHVAGDSDVQYLDRSTRVPNGSYNNQYYGLAIGLVLLAGIGGAGHISGGCFNPAVALGIDISSFHTYWWILYAVWELIGAALAAGLFALTNPHAVKNQSDDGQPSRRARMASEFIGTAFLVLTVGLNVIGKSNSPVFSIAAALTSMIFALGRVSHAHFNPAVTLAVFARGDPFFASRDTISYWTMQFMGGAFGAVMYTIMERGRTFPLEVGYGFDWQHVAVAEFIFTAVLCYIVLAVAYTKQAQRKTQFFGLIIGSAVTAGGIAVGPISGGVFNPAVALGVSLAGIFGGAHEFWHCIPYMFFEVLAGGFAAATYMITRPSEFQRKHHG